ncbi:hypothetical protein FQR65_LT13015 [Abscondita terminalis]|nr:hypothetical protein FQR65_LT13015 [Abscondita terminalis]
MGDVDIIVDEIPISLMWKRKKLTIQEIGMIASYVVMTNFIFSSYAYKNRMIKILQAMVKMDYFYEKLVRRKLNHVGSRRWISFLIITLYVFLVAHFIIGTAIALLTNLNEFTFNTSDIYYVTSIYNGNMTILITFILSELKRRLISMQESTTFQDVENVKALKLIKEIYSKMWNIALELNSIFEISLMLKIAIYSSYLLVVCFWFTSGTILGIPITYYNFVRQAGWFGIDVLDISLIVYHFEAFYDKVRNLRL